MTDYQKSIIVNKPIHEVYTAITKHIADWWSNDLSGAAANQGDNFNIAFGHTKKTFEITSAKPDKQLIWKCSKAYIDKASLNNKSEWVGTEMIWTFNAEGQGTALNFLHQGLNKSFECYDICENGWNYFLESLQQYLTTGTGAPHLKK